MFSVAAQEKETEITSSWDTWKICFHMSPLCSRRDDDDDRIFHCCIQYTQVSRVHFFLKNKEWAIEAFTSFSSTMSDFSNSAKNTQDPSRWVWQYIFAEKETWLFWKEKECVMCFRFPIDIINRGASSTTIHIYSQSIYVFYTLPLFHFFSRVHHQPHPTRKKNLTLLSFSAHTTPYHIPLSLPPLLFPSPPHPPPPPTSHHFILNRSPYHPWFYFNERKNGNPLPLTTKMEETSSSLGVISLYVIFPLKKYKHKETYTYLQREIPIESKNKSNGVVIWDTRIQQQTHFASS